MRDKIRLFCGLQVMEIRAWMIDEVQHDYLIDLKKCSRIDTKVGPIFPQKICLVKKS